MVIVPDPRLLDLVSMLRRLASGEDVPIEERQKIRAAAADAIIDISDAEARRQNGSI